MRIMCVGGGPAGLYFALVCKQRHPEYEVTVVERAAPGVAQGWGVTYTDSLLDRMHRYDPLSATLVREHSVLWRGLHVRLPGRRLATLGGYGFAIARTSLLEILARRAADLGVELRYRCAVNTVGMLDDVDLVVAADGAASRLREGLAQQFGTQVDCGRNLFAWLGTDHAFKGLTFALEQTPAGPIWLHGYPSVAGMSTCVVECAEATHRELRLDSLCADTVMDTLAGLFAEALDGRALLHRNSGGSAQWRRFEQVRNARWHHRNVVLVGDAAHTTHFSIGAGTEEAIKDATTLARTLQEHRGLTDALSAYEARRRPRLEKLQFEAKRSMELYESIESFAHLDAVAFAGVLAGSNNSLASSSPLARLGQSGAVRGLVRVRDAAAMRAAARRRENRAPRSS